MRNRKEKFTDEQAVMELEDNDLDQITGGMTVVPGKDCVIDPAMYGKHLPLNTSCTPCPGTPILTEELLGPSADHGIISEIPYSPITSEYNPSLSFSTSISPPTLSAQL